MSPTRKPSTALQWFPHIPATESAVLDMANSRQIALRIRLRNHYWLTECKPMGPTTVALTRKKMQMIDAQDSMTDEEVAEVLSDHYGFTGTPLGLTIPELLEARGVAVTAGQERQARASAGGLAKAAKAAAPVSVPPAPLAATGNPADF